MSKLRLFFLIILTPVLFFGCNTDSPIPEVYVNFTVRLDNSAYLDLNSIGNSVFYPHEGYRGIIITHTDIDKFEAYDAACTYDPENPDAVVDEFDIYGECRICGSKFNLMFGGYVEKGPAGLGLKTYVVTYNPNANELIIHN